MFFFGERERDVTDKRHYRKIEIVNKIILFLIVYFSGITFNLDVKHCFKFFKSIMIVLMLFNKLKVLGITY